MPSFYIENFGCRATQADGAAMERQFLDRGLERVNTARDAEIVVLNTCTVTEGADKDARASIRRIQRLNPTCRIMVTGCYAQRAPEELAALPGVTWVVGNSHKHRIAEITTATLPSLAGFVPLHQLANRTHADGVEACPIEVSNAKSPAEHPAEVIVGNIFAHTELLAAPVFEAANERTRPNLKVQDGCDNRCAFCVIPYVRGQSRSMPTQRVIGEVRALVDAGYREVVISGINLGRWGRDLPVGGPLSLVVGPPNTCDNEVSDIGDTHVGDREGSANDQRQRQTTSHPLRLVALIRTILDQTSIEKLRISSVEPMDWSDELIALVASSRRIAKHAHVPMQSGSDAVLRRMHRKYRPWHYREKILKIRALMPTAAIGADVMVGFPGESEAEFEETRRMVEELPFTYLHVFTYSARPGTPAATYSNQVPVAIARQRNAVLRELISAKKAAFMRTLATAETTIEAITLPSRNEKFTEALTENYLKVKIAGQHPANRWSNVAIRGTDGEYLLGETMR